MPEISQSQGILRRMSFLGIANKTPGSGVILPFLMRRNSPRRDAFIQGGNNPCLLTQQACCKGLYQSPARVKEQYAGRLQAPGQSLTRI